MHSVTQYVSGYHVDEFVGDSEQRLRGICSLLCVGVRVILYESRCLTSTRRRDNADDVKIGVTVWNSEF